MSFIGTGLREMALKVKRQRTRLALRHEKRLLQKSEINLGREGTSQAANFPELRNEIVALKKLEQEQKEVALRIAQIEEGIKKIEAERQQNTREQNEAIAKLEAEKKPLLQLRNQAKSTADLCQRELSAVERRVEENDAADRDLLKKLSALQTIYAAAIGPRRAIGGHCRAARPVAGRTCGACPGTTRQRGSSPPGERKTCRSRGGACRRGETNRARPLGI